MSIFHINIKILFIGLITGLVNGLFGSGGGTIIVPAMIYLLDIEEHCAHATAIFIILPLSILSTMIYFNNGIIKFDITIIVAIGGVIGGFIGAKILKKIPSKVLRKLFGTFMIIASIRMLIK